jgi:23S rRNA (adenine2503-C2)-methyltransferase
MLIYDLDPSELADHFRSRGEPPYRAVQVWQGLYRHLYGSPDDFTNLPKPLREQMAHEFDFVGLRPVQFVDSQDGQTRKTLFKLPDGNLIEAVLMRYHRRQTLCISSQAGCAMGCVFCATGQMGFKSHLSSGQIVEQVLYYARLLKADGLSVTNVVVMGMGEPFHNYESTMRAIDRLNDAQGFNLGARRFTVSTVGLVPMIRRFADEHRQVNLAVSLHAADDSLRLGMMPITKKYSIGEILEACHYYVEKTRRRVTFEWALIQGVNDTPAEALLLARRLHGLLCHVNAIPLNPTRGFSGQAATRERSKAFKATLEAAGIPCTVRLRRGIDIQAGCGQLAGAEI